MTKKDWLIDMIMRLAALLSISWFAWQSWLAYDLSHKSTHLLLFVAEALTVGLILIAKPTNTRDASILPSLLTLCASFYFFVIWLDGGLELISQSTAQIIMFVGITLQVLAKIWIGRNFGLLPARRGLVSTGPYSIVRHPIYLGYFITHMGFLFSNFSMHNLIVYAMLYAFQAGRIYYEEKKLSEWDDYKVYKQKVKHRIIPGLI